MKQSSVSTVVVPVQPVASQKLGVILAGQNCKINLYQKSTGLFLDLMVDDDPIINSWLCRDRVSMTFQPSYGFVGDLFFKDMLGALDPAFWGLGSRFLLCHMVPN